MNEPITVLIVEDDPRISELHRRFTEKVEGYTVVGIANSLTDAEDMAEVLEPNLVLLDLFFPEGHGMDLLWKMRAKGLSVDIILITAAKDPNSLQDALRGGAFDYIVKPVIFDRFKSSLERYRTYLHEVKSQPLLEQQDIDQFLHRAQTAPAEGESDVPKGIDPLTLKKVCKVFDDIADLGASADEVGKRIGASRNTARRYLEYLITVGFLYADIDYGSVGRPERKFFRRRI